MNSVNYIAIDVKYSGKLLSCVIDTIPYMDGWKKGKEEMHHLWTSRYYIFDLDKKIFFKAPAEWIGAFHNEAVVVNTIAEMSSLLELVNQVANDLKAISDIEWEMVKNPGGYVASATLYQKMVEAAQSMMVDLNNTTNPCGEIAQQLAKEKVEEDFARYFKDTSKVAVSVHQEVNKNMDCVTGKVEINPCLEFLEAPKTVSETYKKWMEDLEAKAKHIPVASEAYKEYFDSASIANKCDMMIGIAPHSGKTNYSYEWIKYSQWNK